MLFGPSPGGNCDQFQLRNFMVPGGRDLLNGDTEEPHFLWSNWIASEFNAYQVRCAMCHANQWFLDARDDRTVSVVEIDLCSRCAHSPNPVVCYQSVHKDRLAVRGLAHL